MKNYFNRAVSYIEEFQLLRTDLWKRFVEQYKEHGDHAHGWRGEYWGKMMRGACFVYAYSHNEQLYRVLTETVEEMLTAQELDGRISTYDAETEFRSWDMWCRKYVLLGMQYYLEICEDKTLAERIVQSMCRQVDYIMEKIGDIEDSKLPITKASDTWRGLNASTILEPIVRLYRVTEEKKYLDFAEYIVNCGGTDIVNIFELAYEDKLYPYQYPVTKAYEMMSCFEGLLEYYRVTGIEKYKTSVVNFANKVLESDVTIIGSCGCTHELFDHSTVRQANTTNGKIAQETCVTVTLMKFMYQLTLATGDAKYVDVFERAFFNAYLGAINTEKVTERTIKEEHPDWCIEPLPFDSYSPLTAGTRGNGVGGLMVMSDKHYYGCCACIGSAGLGLVPKLAILSDDDSITVNLYVNGKYEVTLRDKTKVSLTTDTNYPVDGKVFISVEPERAMRFGLKLRIPAWSKCIRLAVNEEKLKVDEGYTTICRQWSKGDVIELEIDMRTEILRPIPYGHQVLMNEIRWDLDYVIPTYDEEDPMAKNHLALRRGPIILAQENRLGYSVDEPVEICENVEGYVDVKIAEHKIAPYQNLLEVMVPLADGGEMRMTDYASAGKLWTEESKMAAWILIK